MVCVAVVESIISVLSLRFSYFVGAVGVGIGLGQ